MFSSKKGCYQQIFPSQDKVKHVVIGRAQRTRGVLGSEGGGGGVTGRDGMIRDGTIHDTY